jgi:uncharacterized protein YqiB (DUF1249 family)
MSMGLTERVVREEARVGKPLPLIGAQQESANYEINHVNLFLEAIDFTHVTIDKLGEIYKIPNPSVFKVAVRAYRDALIRARGHDVVSASSQEKRAYQSQVVSLMEILQQAVEKGRTPSFKRDAIWDYVGEDLNLAQRVQQEYAPSAKRSRLFLKDPARLEILQTYAGVERLTFVGYPS